MQDLKGFRRYYNDHLHGQLMQFERRRWWLLFYIVLGVSICLAITLFIFSLGMVVMTAFLLLPYWMCYEILRKQIKDFKKEYKPLVVKSILKFIDPRLKYYHDQYVPLDTFNRSSIFPVDPLIYKGEDYIMGKIGEISFEMCELKVMHPSFIRGRLQTLFDGVFFHANFNISSKGRVIIIPRYLWQNFIKTMKNITRYGGYELVDTGHKIFDEEFLVYCDEEVHIKEILTPNLIETINNYHLRSGKQVYASFVDSHFFMAIAEPYHLLDAHVFTSNINFESLAAFYEELYVFTRLVEDFDISH